MSEEKKVYIIQSKMIYGLNRNIEIEMKQNNIIPPCYRYKIADMHEKREKGPANMARIWRVLKNS